MNGRILVAILVAIGVATAASVWYLQVYYYYESVDAGRDAVPVAEASDGAADTLAVRDYRAIDANSSPIRYRACFEEALSLDEARARFAPYPGAEPLTAPFWFDCFDADAIGAALEAGEAVAFLGQKNYAYGVDRIVALTADGHGYVWHQLNNCGDTDNYGTPTTEACPPREDFQ